MSTLADSILKFAKIKDSELTLSKKIYSKNSKQSQGEFLEQFVISNLFQD